MSTSVYFAVRYPAPSTTSTLSLHDALPIYAALHLRPEMPDQALDRPCRRVTQSANRVALDLLGDVMEGIRSEEHTSELQSRVDLVCRLLLEKKKKNSTVTATTGAGYAPKTA